MLISLHTPKSGGTSFKIFLETHYGNRLKLDYNDKPINTEIEERIKNAKNFNKKYKIYLKNYYKLKGIECIHGHFLPYKYKESLNDDKTRFITWLRDPLERLASHYYYWKRAYRQGKSGELHQKVIEEEWDFKRFCFSNEMKNFYTQFLWEFPIENFNFIGLTEHFDEDCSFFAKEFLGEHNIIIPQSNINPENVKSYYKDKIMYNELKDFHSLDYKLYDFALNKRKQRYNDKSPT